VWKWIGRHLSIIVPAASGLALVFVIGVAIGHLRWQPAPIVGSAIAALRDLTVNADAYLFGVPNQHLRDRRFSQDGVVLSDLESMQPGVTFISGLFGNRLGVRLYSAAGQLLYEWPINFFEVDPDVMNYPFDALIHGDHLYASGEFLAVFDGRGIVRVSPCGELIWRNKRWSHHSIDLDEEGFLWTPVYGEPYDDPRVIERPFRFDRIAKFDPKTGKKLVEVDLVAALVDSDKVGLAIANRPTFHDVMHLNDVEVLTADVAPFFPMFEAGDLLLSSRHFNQLWVVSPRESRIKWTFSGPMIGQHDPDFQPDGTITVFDNRTGGTAKPINDYLGNKGGSRILAIDPASNEHRVLYQSDARNTFYTPYRGKHQILDNGNILITETDAGRVFEVTTQGDVVWSFVNGYDEERVGWVMSATRYPESYAAIADTKCP